MKLIKMALIAVLATTALPLTANAAFVLDTGSGSTSTFPQDALDSTDYLAAEFHLNGGETITGIQGLVSGGFSGQPGDTFTMALYTNDGLNDRNGSAVYSAQATYNADGWTGVTVSDAATTNMAQGDYWVVFEVGAADTATTLNLPGITNPGTAPALAFAFSQDAGTSWTQDPSAAFDVQVEVAPVPVPGALLLLGSGLFGVGGLLRRRQAA